MSLLRTRLLICWLGLALVTLVTTGCGTLYSGFLHAAFVRTDTQGKKPLSVVKSFVADARAGNRLRAKAIWSAESLPMIEKECGSFDKFCLAFTDYESYRIHFGGIGKAGYVTVELSGRRNSDVPPVWYPVKDTKAIVGDKDWWRKAHLPNPREWGYTFSLKKVDGLWLIEY